MDRRNCHHNRNISPHIHRQLRILLCHLIQIHALRHQLRHPDLLIDPAHQHLFVDGLVLPPQIVLIQGNVHVVQLPHIGKGLVREQIVYIKCMLRQPDSGLVQHLCPVDQCVHDQILGR